MTTAARPATAPILRMLAAQLVAELRMRWRLPAFSVTSVLLPAVLFTFFGLPFARMTRASGASVGAEVLAGFGAYAVGQVMVFGFGIGVANERAQKMDVLARTTPLPPLVHLSAKIAVGLVFALLSLAVLFAYGRVAGGIALPPAVWLSLVVRLLIGAVPLIALGFAIGYSAGPNAAPAVANLVYLPLSFASGMFMPLSQLPGFVQRVAPYLPTYHHAQLGWSALRPGEAAPLASLAWLLGYTVALGALALWAYQREERRKFA